MGEDKMALLSLPVDMIENIFSYLHYDEIAKNRLVCKSFDEICTRLLNRGFLIIERRHAIALKTVKAQLPRRESERRYHPLARHCDILSSIETRISMLNMTYSKFIDNGICCFIPGKVIDEIKRVLQILESNHTPPRAHEVLQELRDISSMAIEHFDDKISPAFRKKLQDGATAVHTQALPWQDNSLGPLALTQEILQIRRRSVVNAKMSLYLASQYKKFNKRILMYKKVAFRQRKTIRDLSAKLTEQDAAIAELKKRIEECDIKYSEFTHTNQAAGGKVIAESPPAVNQSVSKPLRHFSSQIKLDLSVLPIGNSRANQGKSLPNMKPRKSVIKLPTLYEDAPPAKLAKLEEKETPSTSQESTKKNMSTIRRIANEIQNLTKTSDLNMASQLTHRLGKRSISLTALDDDCGVHSKIKKMD